MECISLWETYTGHIESTYTRWTCLRKSASCYSDKMYAEVSKWNYRV